MRNALLPSELMADIRFPSVIIVTEGRALFHYDLFAISRVLPTVPKIRLSCILCTWLPLRRSEDRGLLYSMGYFPSSLR